jgi:3-dehydroquinate dehydratase-2
MHMAEKILILHGPNVNLLGQHPGDDPEWSVDDVNDQIREKASGLGATLKIYQSNHEGALIDQIHAARTWADAIIINPGALAHTSYVLRDAIASVAKPTIEVHMSDIHRREAWRRKSVLKEVCEAQIVGKGVGSYLLAVERLCGPRPAIRFARPGARKTRGRAARGNQNVVPLRPSKNADAPTRAKTIGRKQAATSKVAAIAPLAAKTIGRQQLSRPDGQQVLTRGLIRQKIADRLAGKITPAGLATWARAKWIDVERGAPAESGQRELLEDSLQSLVLSTAAPARLTDEQLIDLMTQLEG